MLLTLKTLKKLKPFFSLMTITHVDHGLAVAIHSSYSADLVLKEYNTKLPKVGKVSFRRESFNYRRSSVESDQVDC